MQIVSNLHEIPKLIIFSKKNKKNIINVLPVELAQRGGSGWGLLTTD